MWNGLNETETAGYCQADVNINVMFLLVRATRLVQTEQFAHLVWRDWKTSADHAEPEPQGSAHYH